MRLLNFVFKKVSRHLVWSHLLKLLRSTTSSSSSMYSNSYKKGIILLPNEYLTPAVHFRERRVGGRCQRLFISNVVPACIRASLRCTLGLVFHSSRLYSLTSVRQAGVDFILKWQCCCRIKYNKGSFKTKLFTGSWASLI